MNVDFNGYWVSLTPLLKFSHLQDENTTGNQPPAAKASGSFWVKMQQKQ